MKRSFKKSLTVILAVLALTFSVIGVTPARAAGVVGNGTPGSCTETALNNALAGGGTITFNCGVYLDIPITSSLSERSINGSFLPRSTLRVCKKISSLASVIARRAHFPTKQSPLGKVGDCFRKNALATLAPHCVRCSAGVTATVIGEGN